MKPADRERLQASVRQRLLNLAQREGVDFQLVLTRYGLERFLYRLGRSAHKPTLLLKGAFLYHAWRNDVGRPTRDLDLLGFGDPDITGMESIVAEIVAALVPEDGLDFLPASIRGEAIRESSLYDGIRIRLMAMLGRVRLPLQIDIGFGDAAGSKATELTYPTLLDQEPPRVLGYRPEFVIAEKLEAIVVLGAINTRLKDYYDLWQLGRALDLSEEESITALKETFARRGTDLPSRIPPGLEDTFADAAKQGMWAAFIARNGLEVEDVTLLEAVSALRARYWPLLEAAGRGD